MLSCSKEKLQKLMKFIMLVYLDREIKGLQCKVKKMQLKQYSDKKLLRTKL